MHCIILSSSGHIKEILESREAKDNLDRGNNTLRLSIVGSDIGRFNGLHIGSEIKQNNLVNWLW